MEQPFSCVVSASLTWTNPSPRHLDGQWVDRIEEDMLLVLGNGRGSSSIPAALFSVSCGRRTKKVQKRPPGQVPTAGEGLGRGAFEGGPITWRCVEGCGACCKLDKGPSFLTPEEIFSDPSDVRLYRSMVGPDGWCIHYDQPSRTCSIYQGSARTPSKPFMVPTLGS
ncbi:hypothetical protein QJS10_CPB13g01731 [Acorus calamus]|uniref:YkgJ family cysteine cluster protein n=1 Tax=Acorus calamus TaxID=4465 RepID=A0AAV9DHL7_ACOCL|nr:hypothetical protein QJS10_CPB13g01731 [Acorus calamus]